LTTRLVKFVWNEGTIIPSVIFDLREGERTQTRDERQNASSGEKKEIQRILIKGWDKKVILMIKT